MADGSPLLQIMRKPPPPSSAAPSTHARGVPSSAEGRCEVCDAPIEAEHDHVVDLRARALLCACRACHLLFSHEGAGGGRLRAVPQRCVRLTGLADAIDRLDAFDLPIGLAFFLRSSASGRVTAFYPGPAGATESELPMDAWDGLAGAVPALETLATDVEAVLIRRRDAALDGFIVPIDVSYELVGRIRRSWRGFQGGDEVWREIDDFFVRVGDRAEVAGGSPAA